MPRRGAQVGLLLLLLGFLLLSLAPDVPGTLRLAGVSLAWWYAVLAAPAIAAVLTLLAVPRTRRARDTTPAPDDSSGRRPRSPRARPAPRARRR